jgi:hypothetical protein
VPGGASLQLSAPENDQTATPSDRLLTAWTSIYHDTHFCVSSGLIFRDQKWLPLQSWSIQLYQPTTKHTRLPSQDASSSEIENNRRVEICAFFARESTRMRTVLIPCLLIDSSRPNSREGVSCSVATVISPESSVVFQKVRREAVQADVECAFRDMCMLLKAPPLLNSFLLVARNIQYILKVLPQRWSAEDAFPGWAEMVNWALNNQNTLIERAGESLQENGCQKMMLGAPVAIHPMRGMGLSQFPIYSTLCNTQELPEHSERYSMLQAQLLVARREELNKNKHHNSAGYIALYETNTEVGDFARHVRQPDAAARAIREMSFERYGQMLELIQPDHSPEIFAASLPKPGDELPQIPFLHKGIQHIRHFCGLMTSPRSNVTRAPGDSYGGGAGVYGYVEYSETRFGIEYTNGDPDDHSLDLSEQELIHELTIDRELALSHDMDPAELALAGGYARQGDAQQCGSTPGKLASARKRAMTIEIDKDRMPWSAIHLRPREIQGTLLQALISTARAARSGRVDEVELENCALIAVSLETARPIAASASIRHDHVWEGDFLFVPSKHEQVASRWCWRAIEPLYKAERPTVPGMETVRTQHLSYPIHPVADALLREWHRHLQGSRPELFREPLENYENRLTPWLRKLDSTGRLTLSKIARMKWSLLSQKSAGDIAEASLVLGQPHPLSRVPLFYSLLEVDRANWLFEQATSALWNGMWDSEHVSHQDAVQA